MKRVLIRVVVLMGLAGALTFTGGCLDKQKRTALICGIAGGGLGALVGAAASGGSAGYTLLGAGLGATAGAATGAVVSADSTEDGNCVTAKECTGNRCDKCRNRVEKTSTDGVVEVPVTAGN